MKSKQISGKILEIGTTERNYHRATKKHIKKRRLKHHVEDESVSVLKDGLTFYDDHGLFPLSHILCIVRNNTIIRNIDIFDTPSR